MIADTTFFKRNLIFCVFRSPHHNQNLYWQEISSETSAAYQIARATLEKQGFQILAIVLDGKPGVREVFHDIPVQMCHFHQRMIITRYITTRPKLEAGRELRKLTLALSCSNEEEFCLRLSEWHRKWSNFLKEKTVEPETERWHYTHQRIRKAYQSLKGNLPYLFTYQRYPELKIPKTTNSLEGFFSHLKDLVTLHRGLKINLKRKIINQILAE